MKSRNVNGSEMYIPQPSTSKRWMARSSIYSASFQSSRQGYVDAQSIAGGRLLSRRPYECATNVARCPRIPSMCAEYPLRFTDHLHTTLALGNPLAAHNTKHITEPQPWRTSQYSSQPLLLTHITSLTLRRLVISYHDTDAGNPSD